MIDSRSTNELVFCLLNAAEVARKLAISKRYAYHLMATGIIPTVHIGRAARVHEVDLIAYIESLERNSS
jgi:excisionase family DNA binding protein